MEMLQQVEVKSYAEHLTPLKQSGLFSVIQFCCGLEAPNFMMQTVRFSFISKEVPT
jgi:hypothetical protein